MDRRRRVRLACLGAVVAGLAVTVALSPWAAAQSHELRAGQAFRLVKLGEFNSPVYATSIKSKPGTLFVVEQPGRILVLQGRKVRVRPFLDIRSQVQSGGEQGLLSVAFDPAYAKTRRFYVDYTDRNGDTRVVEYRSDGEAAILSSAKQLLFVKDFAANHNGGQLEFGPDGLLYWGNGDGGGAGDPEHNGQNLDRPFAKIMRLDVNAPKARWQLVAYGLRNPWRFSFDRLTGDLYIGDVGQGEWEEVDYLRHGFSRPVNFGWNRFEGTHSYDDSTALLTRGSYVPPVFQYSHSDGCSVTGGYVYRGKAIAAAVGRYFFGDYCSGTIWSLRIANKKASDVRRESITLGGLSSFGEGARGELYLTSVETGGLYQLAP
jgi:glucose/arabinose dehydrogenase